MSKKPETLAIHAGSRLPAGKAVPITPAIHAGAVSWFDSAEDLDGALDGKDFVYTRIRGENATLLEEAVAAGIGEHLIRVSVGLEDPDDVAEDLLQAVGAR